MDKQQNELVKSYLRARELAQEHYKYWKNHEMEYMHKIYPVDKVVEKDLFNDSEQRAKYYNRYVFGEFKFYKLYEYNYANKSIAIAILPDFSRTFVNRKGEESVEGINYEEFSKTDNLSQIIIVSKILNIDLGDIQFATPISPDADINLYNDDFITVIMKNGDKLAIDKNMKPANRKQFLIHQE